MTMGSLLNVLWEKHVLNWVHMVMLPFNDLSVDEVSKILQGCGIDSCGNEILYNSRTGEQMTTEIFIGPTYYQRLNT
jgi:DNA-directed RNA polymerase beta subunit